MFTSVIIGIPSASMNMQAKNVNLIFLGRRYPGQLSINPVYIKNANKITQPIRKCFESFELLI